VKQLSNISLFLIRSQPVSGGRTASLGADLLRSEELGRLEGKDGVALLDDLQVVVVVAEGAVKAVKVHFSEDDLSETGKQKQFEQRIERRTLTRILKRGVSKYQKRFYILNTVHILYLDIYK